MGTKNNPGKFDCYENAEPDEPMFIFLARDECAPQILREWCDMRIRMGKNTPDDEQITEAIDCARAMEVWFSENRA